MHDELLRQMPQGATHDAELCPVCARDQHDDAEVAAVKTYSEDELQAEVARAVAEATGPLSAQLAELQGKETKASVDAAVAAAVEEHQARITELEAQLDAAVIKANEVTEQHDQLVTFLAETAAETERQTLVAARRSERVAQVAEVTNFSEEDLEKRADRWADMDDAEFAEALADLRATTEAAKAALVASGDKTPTTPTATAMTAAAVSTGNAGRVAAIRGALALRGTPVAPSTIN